MACGADGIERRCIWSETSTFHWQLSQLPAPRITSAMRTPREPHKSRISSSKFKRAIAWWRAWTSSTRFRLCTNLPL